MRALTLEDFDIGAYLGKSRSNEVLAREGIDTLLYRSSYKSVLLFVAMRY